MPRSSGACPAVAKAGATKKSSYPDHGLLPFARNDGLIQLRLASRSALPTTPNEDSAIAAQISDYRFCRHQRTQARALPRSRTQEQIPVTLVTDLPRGNVHPS